MSKRTPRLTSFACPDCDFTTPKREEVQLHRRAAHAKASAPRYTAVSPKRVTELWSQAVIQAAREQRSEPHVFADLLAAETERALEAFRAWLIECEKDETVGDAVFAWKAALGELDRRFGRTP